MTRSLRSEQPVVPRFEPAISTTLPPTMPRAFASGLLLSLWEDVARRGPGARRSRSAPSVSEQVPERVSSPFD